MGGLSYSPCGRAKVEIRGCPLDWG
jgi:hypothetical protein